MQTQAKCIVENKAPAPVIVLYFSRQCGYTPTGIFPRCSFFLDRGGSRFAGGLLLRGFVQAVDRRQQIIRSPQLGDKALVTPDSRFTQQFHIFAGEFIPPDRFAVQPERCVCKNLLSAQVSEQMHPLLFEHLGG